MRAIIQKLNRFPEIADETLPDFYGSIDSHGLLENIKLLAKLYWLKSYLECERGNYSLAIEYLVEFDSIIRKLLPNARDIVLKSFCYGLVSKDIDCANHIINSDKVSRSQIQTLATHLPDLTDEQTSLRRHLFFPDSAPPTSDSS